MGVPAFFRKLVKKYGHIIARSAGQVGGLYIDANCLFHPQCFKVLAENPDLRDENELFDKMAERIVTYIDHLIECTNPRDIVYIAVDGVAPLAKINQQRVRRFGYANNYRHVVYRKHRIPFNDSWSNIVITPGTQFMEKLHTYIERYYANKKTSYRVMYDSYHMPGEGEHKILQLLKSMLTTNGLSTVIYGLDADLIFLSLSCHIQSIYLLREADQFMNDADETLCYVNIDTVRQSINDEMNGLARTVHRIDFTDDYIFICYFLGNDFLPHLPSIDIGHNGLEHILEDYINVFMQLQTTLVRRSAEKNLTASKPNNISIDRGDEKKPNERKSNERKSNERKSNERKSNDRKSNERKSNERKSNDRKSNERKSNERINISMDFLVALLTRLSDRENHYFQTVLPYAMNRHRTKRCYETEPYKREIWMIENLKDQLSDTMESDPVRLGDGNPDDWKFRYYNHYMHTDIHMQETIDSMSHNYIEGLLWVARYYFEKCSSWRWQYRYTHAPFLSDLVKYLNHKQIMNDFNVPYAGPIDMRVQLVSIIPSTYSHIIPIELQHLSQSVDSPIIDMFPINYKLDTLYKTQLYKCIPLIPYLDIDRVIDATNRVLATKSSGNQ